MLVLAIVRRRSNRGVEDSMKARLVSFAIGLGILCQSGFAQVIEQQAWSVTFPSGSSSYYLGSTVASDYPGYTYFLTTRTQGSGYGFIVESTDFQGQPSFREGPIGLSTTAALGMGVDPISSAIFMAYRDSGVLDDVTYEQNGLATASNLGFGNFLGMAFCPGTGEGAFALQDGGTFYVRFVTIDGSFALNGISDPTFSAAAVSFDPNGDVLVAGTLMNGEAAARCYDWLGKVQWTISYANTSTDTFTVDAVALDSQGTGYAVVNDLHSGGARTFEVVGMKDAAQVFAAGGTGKASKIVPSDQPHVFVAGMDTTPFLQCFDGMGSLWKSAFNVVSMSCPPDDSGTVMVGIYNVNAKAVYYYKLSPAGATQYYLHFPATASAGVGSISWDTNPFGGTTGYLTGTTTTPQGPAPILIKVVEGAFLKAILVPASVVGGNPFNGTVYLSAKTPTSYFVRIWSSDPQLANVSSAPQFAVGTQTQTFTVQTGAVDKPKSVTLTGVDQRGVTKTQTLSIVPASVASLGVSPSSVIPNKTATGKAKLNGPAGPGGVFVSLSSDKPTAVVPASVKIGSQSTSGTFTIITKPVSAATTATITATTGTAKATATLTLNPPTLSSVNPITYTVIGGHSFNMSVQFNGNVASPTAVALASSNPALLPVPSSVSIATGGYYVSFPVTSHITSVTSIVTVTGKYAGVTKTSTITVAH